MHNHLHHLCFSLAWSFFSINSYLITLKVNKINRRLVHRITESQKFEETCVHAIKLTSAIEIKFTRFVCVKNFLIKFLGNFARFFSKISTLSIFSLMRPWKRFEFSIFLFLFFNGWTERKIWKEVESFAIFEAEKNDKKLTSANFTRSNCVSCENV